MKVHLPSVEALTSGDDRLLHQELGGLAVRRQTAVVRALLDQMECLSALSAIEGLRAQLVEELARLGCTILEAAATLSSQTEPAPASGTLAICRDELSEAS